MSIGPLIVADPVVTVPDLPPTTSGPGVAMVAPPAALLPSITASIGKAMSTLAPDQHGALVGIVTETGTNLALVHRVGENFAVSAWMGRSWGSDPNWSYGAEAKLTW